MNRKANSSYSTESDSGRKINVLIYDVILTDLANGMSFSNVNYDLLLAFALY